MAEPFLSEIRMMSFGFPPKGWAFCDGQLLPINQNQALFSLLGTVYGGDGRVNFALPDLRGRVPTHTGGMGHFLGERGGEPSHTLTIAEIPQHVHVASAANTPATTNIPTNALMLAQPGFQIYHTPTNLGPLNPGTIATVGGSQAHLNMQPFLTINFSIALQGIFPSQT
jgi:microcystin-dependent protein